MFTGQTLKSPLASAQWAASSIRGPNTPVLLAPSTESPKSSHTLSRMLAWEKYFKSMYVKYTHGKPEIERGH